MGVEWKILAAQLGDLFGYLLVPLICFCLSFFFSLSDGAYLYFLDSFSLLFNLIFLLFSSFSSSSAGETVSFLLSISIRECSLKRSNGLHS